MAKLRMFISIDIDVLPGLLEFQKKLRNTDTDLKIAKPENIHLTLKFLGNTEEQLIPKIGDAIRQSVTDITPFTVNLRGAGVFPSPNYMRVIWVGIQPAGENENSLRAISQRINENLEQYGFKKEKKFTAHITLARVKSARNKATLQQLLREYDKYEFGAMDMKEIRLKKSILTPQGPVYETLLEIKI